MGERSIHGCHIALSVGFLESSSTMVLKAQKVSSLLCIPLKTARSYSENGCLLFNPLNNPLQQVLLLSHLTYEKTEVQRVLVTSLKPHS